MHDYDIGATIRQYIVAEILEGDGDNLDSQTPLLEWGILNSMEVARLLSFIHARFGAHIATAEVTPANFRNIQEIVALIATRDRNGGRSD